MTENHKSAVRGLARGLAIVAAAAWGGLLARGDHPTSSESFRQWTAMFIAMLGAWLGWSRK